MRTRSEPVLKESLPRRGPVSCRISTSTFPPTSRRCSAAGLRGHQPAPALEAHGRSSRAAEPSAPSPTCPRGSPATALDVQPADADRAIPGGHRMPGQGAQADPDGGGRAQGAKLPTDLIGAIPKIVQAAEPVIECALSFTPAGLIPFIKDLLCLIIKALNCFRGQLKSVVKIMEGTALQIDIARPRGMTSCSGACIAPSRTPDPGEAHDQSLEALSIILDLAGDLMQIVAWGRSPCRLSGAGRPGGARRIPAGDASSSWASLQIAADGLGGCQS